MSSQQEVLFPFPPEKLSPLTEEHWVGVLQQESWDYQQKVTLLFRRAEWEVELVTFYTPELPFFAEAMEEFVHRLRSETEVDNLSWKSLPPETFLDPEGGVAAWGKDAFTDAYTPLEQLLMLLNSRRSNGRIGPPLLPSRRLLPPLSPQALRKALGGKEAELYLSPTPTSMALSLVPKVGKSPFPSLAPLAPSSLTDYLYLYLFGNATLQRSYKQVARLYSLLALFAEEAQAVPSAHWEDERLLQFNPPGHMSLTTPQGEVVRFSLQILLSCLPWTVQELPKGETLRGVVEGMTVAELALLLKQLVSLLPSPREEMPRYSLLRYIQELPVLPEAEVEELMKAWFPQEERRPLLLGLQQQVGLTLLLRELLPQREAFTTIQKRWHFVKTVHPYLISLLQEGLGAEATLRLLLEWPEEEAFLSHAEVQALLLHPAGVTSPSSWWLPLLRS